MVERREAVEHLFEPRMILCIADDRDRACTNVSGSFVKLVCAASDDDEVRARGPSLARELKTNARGRADDDRLAVQLIIRFESRRPIHRSPPWHQITWFRPG